MRENSHALRLVNAARCAALPDLRAAKPNSRPAMRGRVLLGLSLRHKKSRAIALLFLCEETHKRCVSVGKNAKKVRYTVHNNKSK